MIRLKKDETPEYAEAYTAKAYESQPENRLFLRRLAQAIGKSFRGQRVLDLGAGPGQFTALFAEEGAEPVWHDISINYQVAAQRRIEASGLHVNYVNRSMDDLTAYPAHSFDFVFCRLCWYYSSNEWALYRQIMRILKPGGAFFLSTHDARTLSKEPIGAKNIIRRLSYHMHEITGWKLVPVPANPRRLHRWLFASKDFVLLDQGESSIAFWVLGRKQPAVDGQAHD